MSASENVERRRGHTDALAGHGPALFDGDYMIGYRRGRAEIGQPMAHLPASGTKPAFKGVKFRASVAIVVRNGDKLLAVNNRRWGGFSLPGGKVDPGETLDDAARRELEEETGCKARSIREIGGKVHDPVGRDDDGSGWFCVAYVADIGPQIPRSNEQDTQPFWVTESVLLENGGNLYSRDWYTWLFRLLRLGA